MLRPMKNLPCEALDVWRCSQFFAGRFEIVVGRRKDVLHVFVLTRKIAPLSQHNKCGSTIMPRYTQFDSMKHVCMEQLLRCVPCKGHIYDRRRVLLIPRALSPNCRHPTRMQACIFPWKCCIWTGWAKRSTKKIVEEQRTIQY